MNMMYSASQHCMVPWELDERGKTVNTKALRITCCLFGVLISSLTGCKGKKSVHEVVIYTSLDKVFSQPILEAFEKQTGINVLPVYDSEATKTTGLVNRLIAEKNNPRADAHCVWKGVRYTF